MTRDFRFNLYIKLVYLELGGTRPAYIYTSVPNSNPPHLLACLDSNSTYPDRPGELYEIIRVCNGKNIIFEEVGFM